MDHDVDATQASTYAQKIPERQADREQLEKALEACVQEQSLITQREEQKQKAILELNEQRKTLEQEKSLLEARRQALSHLQKAALGKDHEARRTWLSEKGLHDARRLAEELEVESPWELAVETVLGTIFKPYV